MLLYEHESKSAAYWFAAEEYIMSVIKPDEPVVMLWSTDDTIMVGANQIVEAECDLAFARDEGIEVVRRSSGGGTIFADRGTLQYTVIFPFGDKCDLKDIARDWLAGPVITTLKHYGVNASLEGRNDISIYGKKVSGLAQYIRGGYICSHGSLLFSTDLEKLTRCLTVDREKFKTKAVASVRARVASVSMHIAEQDLNSFKAVLLEAFVELQKVYRNRFLCASSLEPASFCQLLPYETEDTLEFLVQAGFSKQTPGAPPIIRGRIEENEVTAIINGRYKNPEWTYGREPAFTFTKKERFPGGLIEVFLDVNSGVIQNARINGDFLSLRPVSELEEKLKGVPHRAEALSAALGEIDVNACLGSLGSSELLEVLL